MVPVMGKSALTWASASSIRVRGLWHKKASRLLTLSKGRPAGSYCDWPLTPESQLPYLPP